MWRVIGMELFGHRVEEFKSKLHYLRDWMAQHKVDNLLITQTHNFSWLTCGGENFVFLAQNSGSAHLLVTPNKVYLASNNIETNRAFDEELNGLPIENGEYVWHLGADEVQNHFAQLTSGAIVKDTEVENELKILRDPLYPDEIERYRWLGYRAEEAIRMAAQQVKPGMTEYEAAALISDEVIKREIWPVVLLVAADERAYKYRHPLPTNKPIQDYCMLVLGARRFGLHVSITRCISFKPVGEELQRKHDSVCKVDAALNLSCRPGVSYGEVMQKGIEMYDECGFADEWQMHHQGGPTGFLGRTLKATPESKDKVLINQVVAWNPTISGTKSEDTMIVREKGIEVITEARDWPMIDVQIGNQVMKRCDILERR